MYIRPHTNRATPQSVDVHGVALEDFLETPLGLPTKRKNWLKTRAQKWGHFLTPVLGVIFFSMMYFVIEKNEGPKNGSVF